MNLLTISLILLLVVLIVLIVLVVVYSKFNNNGDKRNKGNKENNGNKGNNENKGDEGNKGNKEDEEDKSLIIEFTNNLDNLDNINNFIFNINNDIDVNKNYVGDYINKTVQINNNRKVDITKPRCFNKKLPVVLFFQPSGDFGITGSGDKDKSALKSSFNYLINKNICIVFLYPDPDDTWYYMNDNNFNDSFTCKNDIPNGISCWNSSDNPDLRYLQKTMDILYTDKDLDLNKMVIIGYSAGAQMVSNAIGEFPLLKTLSNKSFPNIKAAFIIAGGSQYCYAYKDVNNPPDIFLPCIDKKTRLCCPRDTTEKNFMTGKCSSDIHPPTFLFQTENDAWADPNASNHYFDSCKKFNLKCGKIIAKNQTNHGLVRNQMKIFINLILFYLH